METRSKGNMFKSVIWKKRKYEAAVSLTLE